MDPDRVGRPRLVEIERGVEDPEAVTEFIAWLLEAKPDEEGATYGFAFANGVLSVHPDASRPVSIRVAGTRRVEGEDPDGVAVRVGDAVGRDSHTSPAVLDHVALTCADVGKTTDFYLQWGFEVTWSARGDEDCDEGPQVEPVSGADWIHVSGGDGYLSLSQADWEDYGVHSPAAGPPRFIHVGLAVEDLAKVTKRLEDASVGFVVAPTSAIGERIYLNDPDGDPRRGRNIELVEYRPAVVRSGRLP